MSDYLQAVVLGIVEGLTEFLPVSSTAHLRIVQSMLGIDLRDPYWKTFSVVIQVGAILCLPVYFWHRVVGLAQHFPRGVRGDRLVHARRIPGWGIGDDDVVARRQPHLVPARGVHVRLS